jgi:hypothetical protein
VAREHLLQVAVLGQLAARKSGTTSQYDVLVNIVANKYIVTKWNNNPKI